MADFGGKTVKFPQNAMALAANMPNRVRNIRNFPFDHT